VVAKGALGGDTVGVEGDLLHVATAVVHGDGLAEKEPSPASDPPGQRGERAYSVVKDRSSKRSIYQL
jgi:hypothetical protein